MNYKTKVLLPEQQEEQRIDKLIKELEELIAKLQQEDASPIASDVPDTTLTKH